jgi:hypothetical protein
MYAVVDSMPNVWRKSFHGALPNIDVNLQLFKQPEERAMLMKLYPLLTSVTIANEVQVSMNTKDELPLLSKLLSGGNRIAASHASKGGTAAEVFLFRLKFDDLSEAFCIDLPLTAELRNSLNAQGPSLKLRIVFRDGKVKCKCDGLQRTTGACMDLNIKHPAVTLTQHIRISDHSVAKWQPQEGGHSQDIDVCAFLQGMAKAKEALSKGVLCTICLRDPPTEISRRHRIADVSSLGLDRVRQVKFVPSVRQVSV